METTKLYQTQSFLGKHEDWMEMGHLLGKAEPTSMALPTKSTQQNWSHYNWPTKNNSICFRLWKKVRLHWDPALFNGFMLKSQICHTSHTDHHTQTQDSHSRE
jgi:hypothetical protein